MSATWEFVKRHKGKIIVGGLALGGAIGLLSQSPLIHNEKPESYEAEEIKFQGRKHYVFDSNHRVCDENITRKMAPQLMHIIEGHFDVDGLVRKIQTESFSSHEQKVEMWNKLKLNSICSITAAAYSYSILTVTYKSQVSILCADICDQFRRNQTEDNSWLGYMPESLKNLMGHEAKAQKDVSGISGANRQIFLNCIKFFNGTGIYKLFGIIEEAAAEVCKKYSLSSKLNNESIRHMFDEIDHKVLEVLKTELKNLIAPLSDEESRAQDAVILLLKRLLIILESAWCLDTIAFLADIYYSAACAKLPTDMNPFARIIPGLSDSYTAVASTSYDGPLQKSLCSSEIHRFATKVFDLTKK